MQTKNIDGFKFAEYIAKLRLQSLAMLPQFGLPSTNLTSANHKTGCWKYPKQCLYQFTQQKKFWSSNSSLSVLFFLIKKEPKKSRLLSKFLKSTPHSGRQIQTPHFFKNANLKSELANSGLTFLKSFVKQGFVFSPHVSGFLRISSKASPQLSKLETFRIIIIYH
jgi:hypothetical protein